MRFKSSLMWVSQFVPDRAAVVKVRPISFPEHARSRVSGGHGSGALTYTYLDCLLGIKMRGHKMAEIWEWLLMGSTADQYQDRPAGLLLWFVLVCRVMPRSLMFQEKLQTNYNYTRPKVPYLTVVSLYSCNVYWKMEFNLFRFSTIIYLLASYCKWFYLTKVD